jgi:hypothetical protein
MHQHLLSVCATSRRKTNLAGGHGLGDHSLQGKLLLLQVIRGGIFDLELSHGVAESRLDLVLSSALELERHGGVRDDLLNSRDVGLELLSRLELLAERLVAVLELLRIWIWVRFHASGLGVWLTIDHVLDFRRGQLANRVGDSDVGAAARGLLGRGDLEDTVDVDLEDDLKDSITSLHWGDRGKGELSERGVILAVHTLTLVNRELDSLLVV